MLISRRPELLLHTVQLAFVGQCACVVVRDYVFTTSHTQKCFVSQDVGGRSGRL